MIRGVGVDIVQLSRIRDAQAGDRLAERVLSPNELLQWNQVTDGARFLAKRWAIKEAFGKACGTGLRSPLTWQALWVEHDDLGAPHLRLSPALEATLAAREIRHWHISVSDEREYIVAIAVVET
jgi:holo-[acyl-carrier protein] synthase